MNPIKQKWLDALGRIPPSAEYGKLILVKKYLYDDFLVELYVQENGDGTHQRVMMLFPKNMHAPLPSVAVPFYFPEAMLGFDPASGERLAHFEGIEMMLHLVRRGYITACADTFHLTYIKSDKARQDFTRWQDASAKLIADHPDFTGMGKLYYDTELLIDVLCADPRVDNSRIAIAGHSLGGKMAFYNGCLDERICAILASDFGISWEQTNWSDDWYWGKKLPELISRNMNHAELLTLASPKPFCLIAGQYDNQSSESVIHRASGYELHGDRILFINHATGHRPPMWALEQGYDFLDKWLKK